MQINKDFFSVVALATALISGSATATAQEAGISQQIPDAAEVVSVTIAMAPPDLFTRARLGEAGLLGYGCSFSSDSRSVAALDWRYQAPFTRYRGSSGRIPLA